MSLPGMSFLLQTSCIPRLLLCKLQEMKKQMLITGSSRGIGRAIADYFNEKFQIIRVSRTEGDLVGDLTDVRFRKKIIEETKPDVLVNCAGIYPNVENYLDCLELNFVAAAHLTIELGKKMKSGTIINISSVSAAAPSNGSIDSIVYKTSKAAISCLGEQFAFTKDNYLRVCTIEPGFVLTDLNNIKNRYQEKNSNDFITKMNIKPMDPELIARQIEWILNQPPEINLSSVRMSNSFY